MAGLEKRLHQLTEAHAVTWDKDPSSSHKSNIVLALLQEIWYDMMVRGQALMIEECKKTGSVGLVGRLGKELGPSLPDFNEFCKWNWKLRKDVSFGKKMNLCRASGLVWTMVRKYPQTANPFPSVSTPVQEQTEPYSYGNRGKDPTSQISYPKGLR